SGMYVRLAFAVAAHLEPEILVVDEVLAVGDAAFQKKCLGKMGEIAEGGRTVLFVSHNIRAIQQLCQRTILLKQGRLANVGLSKEVVDLYAQSMVKTAAFEDVLEVISRLPPDPGLRLKSIAVLQDGHSVTDILNGKLTIVQIEYDVLQETPGLFLYLELYDSEGTLLFESVHNGDADGIPTAMPGAYISRALIPANFLAPIRYELWVGANIYNVRKCIPEPIRIPLNVQATGRVNRAYPGSGAPGGKLAPLLEWTTEQLH
ncbi:MAG: ABC transporter ATP-binding protein, partial [Candidatus Omnitrophica bacterium]|nr:ABC transporter ATP-binding protein [Candidatus Omnitrophota bacterium]